MTFEELAKAVYDRCHQTGTFTLRSGRVSNEYFDKYLFESDPRLLSAIAHQIHSRILYPKFHNAVNILAGLETGGIPIATALSLRTGIPQIFVRKKAKEYGTAKLAEGIDFAGKDVLMVEDVITTGGQVIESAIELRNGGVRSLGLVCVINRGGLEAVERLQGAGLTLHSLFEAKGNALV